MQDSAPVSSELRLMASTVLADLLTWQHCAPQRQPLLQTCIKQLEQGSSVPQTLRLCCKLLSSFPSKAPRKKGETLFAVLEWLARDNNLLPIFFDNFTQYHLGATAKFEKLRAALALASETRDRARIESAEGALRVAEEEHLHQLQERIKFLNFCIISAPLTLTQQQLDSLWERCIMHALCPHECDLLLRWIEQARTNSSHALDAESTCHLFLRAAALDLEELSPTGA